MGTGAIGTNRLTNGEAENSLHKQADQAPPEGFVARCQDLLSDGSNAALADTEELSHSHSLEPNVQPDAVSLKLDPLIAFI